MKWKKLISGALAFVMVFSSAVSGMPTAAGAAETDETLITDTVEVSEDFTVKNWHTQRADAYTSDKVLSVRNDGHSGLLGEAAWASTDDTKDDKMSFLVFDLSEYLEKKEDFRAATLRLVAASFRRDLDESKQGVANTLNVAAITTEQFGQIQLEDGTDAKYSWNRVKSVLQDVTFEQAAVKSSESYTITTGVQDAGASYQNSNAGEVQGMEVTIDITSLVQTVLNAGEDKLVLIMNNNSTGVEQYFISQDGAVEGALSNATPNMAPSLVLARVAAEGENLISELSTLVCPAPLEGETPQSIELEGSNLPYTIGETTWKADGAAMGAADQFQCGKTYTSTAVLTANEGRIFDESVNWQDALSGMKIYKKVPSDYMDGTADSAQGDGDDGPASWAVDGNENTIWHSNYGGGQVGTPISGTKVEGAANVGGVLWNIAEGNNTFTISLSEKMKIGKFQYVSRDHENGRIRAGKLQYKTANGSFEDIPGAEFSWPGYTGAPTKTVEWETPVETTEIKLIVTQATGNGSNPYITAKEFYLYEALELAGMKNARATRGEDGSTLTIEFPYTVACDQEITDIVAGTVALAVGATETLSPSVKVGGASADAHQGFPDVTYSYEVTEGGESVAVDNSGRMTGKTVGEVVIRVTASAENKKTYSKDIAVSVNKYINGKLQIAAPQISYTAPAEGAAPTPAEVISDTHYHAEDVANDRAKADPVNLTKVASSPSIQAEKCGDIWGFNGQLQSSSTNDKFDVLNPDPLVITFKLYLTKLSEGAGSQGRVLVEKGDEQYAVQLTDHGLEWYAKVGGGWPTVSYAGFNNDSVGQWHNVIAVMDSHEKARIFVDKGYSDGLEKTVKPSASSSMFSIGRKLGNSDTREFTSDYGYLTDVKFYSGKGVANSPLADINLQDLDSFGDKGLAYISNLLETVDPAAIYTLNPYDAKTVWLDGDAQMQPDGKFACGHSYKAKTTITPHDGYAFAAGDANTVKQNIANGSSVTEDQVTVTVQADGSMEVIVDYGETSCNADYSISNVDSEILLALGDTAKLAPELKLVSDGVHVEANPSYSYEITSGNDIISITDQGIITAITPGTASVTITAAAGGRTYTKEISVTVVRPKDIEAPRLSYTAPAYGNYPAPAEVEYDSDACHESVKNWASNAEELVKVNEDSAAVIGNQNGHPYFLDQLKATTNTGVFDVTDENPLVISFKLNLKSIPTDSAEHTILAKGNQYAFVLNTQNGAKELKLYMHSTENHWPQSVYPIDDSFLDEWHDIILVIDGRRTDQGLGFSVDGSAFTITGGDGVTQTVFGHVDAPFTIGTKKDEDNFANPFDSGWLSDIKVYTAQNMSESVKSKINLSDLRTNEGDNTASYIASLMETVEPAAYIAVTPYSAKTTWSAGDEPLLAGAKFAAGTAYTATTTFTAHTGFVFPTAEEFKEQVQVVTGADEDAQVSVNVSPDGSALTVEVVYPPTTPSVTFNVNHDDEAEGNTATVTVLAEGKKVSEPQVPVRAGWHFDGWYTFADDGDKIVFEDGEYAVTENTTVYAHWRQEFSVTFDAVLPDMDAPASRIVADGDLIGELPELSGQEGYRFEGWYRSDQFAESDKADAATSVSADMNLVAKWTVTVTFNAGYEGAEPTVVPVTYNTSVTEPAAPENPDTTKLFAGWYQNLGDTVSEEEYDFNQSVTEPITLDAVWAGEDAVWTVTFKDGDAELGAKKVLKDKTTTPYNAKKEFYELEGWYEAKDFTGEKFDFNQAITDNLTLYVNWREVKYTVKFETGVEDLTVPDTETNVGKVSEPQNVVRTGYTLEGWYRDQAHTQKFDFAKDTVSANGTILYANWTLNQYTVTFNLNDKENEEECRKIEEKAYYDTLVSQPKNISLEGYDLEGWYTDKNCETEFDILTQKITGDITLHAKWKPKEYEVKLHSNYDGAAVATETVKVSHGGKIVIPEGLQVLSREGYTLEGWYEDAECTSAKKVNLASYEVTGEKELYAKWKRKEYEVKLHSNYDGAAVATETVKVSHGGKIEIPETSPILSREGYTLEGWYEDAECTSAKKVNLASYIVTGEKDLFANWTEDRDDTVAVTGISLDKTEVELSSAGEQAILTATVAPGNATNKGVDWNTSDSSVATVEANEDGQGVVTAVGTGEAVITATAAGDTTKTAEAKITVTIQEGPGPITQYEVDFDANKGTGAPAKIMVDAGSTAQKPAAAPKRTGYTFMGWCTDAAGKNEYDFSSPVTGNLRLFAKWEQNKYTVKFNADGGMPAPADQTVLWNGLVKQPTGITKTGYKFIGWYKDAAFKTAFRFASDRITANTVLYAKWEAEVANGASQTYNGVEYTVDNAAKKTVIIKKADSKKAKKVKIPKTVKINGIDCTVVGIGKNAFKNCKKMTTLTIEANITKIETGAFQNCKKLKTVTLKCKTLKTIKKGAFKGTKKGISVKAKGLSKKQKNALLKKLKKAGMKNPKVR